jgi:hypothetical protein
MEPFEDFMQKYLESAAYHEMAHEVVSVVLNIPIRELGVRIDSKGNGVAHTFRRNAGNLNNAATDIVEREQSIILLSAGYISQLRVFPDAPPVAEKDDQMQIDALLNEMYKPDSSEWLDAKSRLR